ncbi:MAG: transmembrane 220 family protein [Longimicrobiales bacterium]
MRLKLWTLANAVMLLAFVLSVVVQYNDPDPFLWMALYGLAAVACVLALLRRGHWLFPALLLVLTLGWAAILAPRVLGQVRFLDMFGAFEMKNVGIEESREMYGLLIVAVWMAVLTIAGKKSPTRPAG